MNIKIYILVFFSVCTAHLNGIHIYLFLPLTSHKSGACNIFRPSYVQLPSEAASSVVSNRANPLEQPGLSERLRETRWYCRATLREQNALHVLLPYPHFSALVILVQSPLC